MIRRARFANAIVTSATWRAWPTPTTSSTGSSPGCWSAARHPMLFLVGRARRRSVSSTSAALRAALRQVANRRAGAELQRQRYRDHLHPRARTPASRRWCPDACRGDRALPLLSSGALADVVEDQFRRLFAGARHRRPASAARRSSAMPASARCRPGFCWRSPSSPTPPGCWTNAGAVAAGAVPVRRPRGTTGWLAGGRHAFGGRRPGLRRSAFVGSRAAAPSGPGRHRAARRQERVFFPDRSWSRRWRASWPANGMTLVEVGAVPAPPTSPTSWRRRRALRSPRPGRRPPARPLPGRARLISSSAVWAGQPARGGGHDHEMVDRAAFTPVQGFEQAADLAELFARLPDRRSMPAGGRR